MNLEDQAVAEYGGASNCAQSILVTYLPALGFRTETAGALGSGLGGGVGGRQEICGALNGGAIVLSYAKQTAGDPDPGGHVAELVAGFRERFGSARCRELLGYDRNDPASVAKAAPDAKEICSRCVRFVARALDGAMDGPEDAEASAGSVV